MRLWQNKRVEGHRGENGIRGFLEWLYSWTERARLRETTSLVYA